MAIEQRLRVKTLMMVLAMVVCANVGDLLLKRGMSEIGAVRLTPAGLTHAFVMTVSNGDIWAGIAILIGFMLSYMTVLSWADYSYVMPAGAFGYALLTLLAVVFLHESVSWRRWIGVVLICAGVLLVGRTKPRTTQSKPRVTEVAVGA
jgi:drug/metabolite transporter (DMT)-like permease